MSVQLGPHEFEYASYDSGADVLYLRSGRARPAKRTYATPEGHAVRYDENDQVIGITIVNAKLLSERDGTITVTVPDQIEASAEELAALLV